MCSTGFQHRSCRQEKSHLGVSLYSEWESGRNPAALRKLSSPQQSPPRFVFVLKKPSHKDRYDIAGGEPN